MVVAVASAAAHETRDASEGAGATEASSETGNAEAVGVRVESGRETRGGEDPLVCDGEGGAFGVHGGGGTLLRDESRIQLRELERKGGKR